MLYSYEFKVVKRIKYLNKMVLPLIKSSGRSNIGRLILRGRGGGFKRYYRILDFKRLIVNIPGKIIRFEYDPSRSSFIMLVLYLNGFLSYHLAPSLVRVGFFIMNGSRALVRVGNGVPILNCNVGTFLHSLTLSSPNGKLGRSAGCGIYLVRKMGSFVLVRLSSKEERFVEGFNKCVIGKVSYDNKKELVYKSAGILRRLGFRPKVRGVAKNPIDHPHGGGEGRTSGGQPSVSPWGMYTKGIRTTTRAKRRNLYQWGFFRRRDGKVW